MKQVQNDTNPQLLSGPLTPTEGVFDEKSVQQGQGTSLITESMISALDDNAPKLGIQQREVKQSSSAEAQPIVDFLRDLKEISGNLAKISDNINLNSKQLEEKERIFAEKEKLFESEVGEKTETGLGSVKFSRGEPHVRILNEIQGRLPLLVKEYEAIKTNNSTEARTKFVSFYLAEIGSAFKNIVAQLENAKIKDLKDQVSVSMNSAKAFRENEKVTEFVKLALQQIQDPSATVIAPAKYVVVGTWIYNLLNSLKAFIALTGAYMLGKSEAYILSLLPLAAKNLVSAIQQYSGSPTVPLLCFGVAYALYLLVQLGAAAKERKWPTEAKVAEEAQKQAITKLFAQNAITV